MPVGVIWSVVLVWSYKGEGLSIARRNRLRVNDSVCWIVADGGRVMWKRWVKAGD